MQYFETTIIGIDGSGARFAGYLPENYPDIVPTASVRPCLCCPAAVMR